MKDTQKPRKEGYRVLWLTVLMFGTAVLFMGFHNDYAFWAAGGLGILVSLLGYFLNWRP